MKLVVVVNLENEAMHKASEVRRVMNELVNKLIDNQDDCRKFPTQLMPKVIDRNGNSAVSWISVDSQNEDLLSRRSAIMEELFKSLR